MKTFLASLIMFIGLSLSANTGWNPRAQLLDAVCQLESSGGRFLIGDAGLSLGHFQFQKAAWLDVSARRKKKNLQTHNYNTHVLNPQINRAYAADYLAIIHERLKRQYGREPLPSEIYAAYNMGLTKFRKCNYDLARVNKITAGKCRQLEAMLK